MMLRPVILCLMLLPLTGCAYMQWAFGNTPRRANTRMEDPDFPDLRRIGMNDFMAMPDYAKKPPYTTRYAQIAKNDPDYLVRATAVRTLTICRDTSATPTYIAALNDSSDVVRREGAHALDRMPDNSAVEPLRKVVLNNTETRDVRIKAMEAIRHYKTLPTAQALIQQLQEKDFSLAFQARESLKDMFGKDFGYNQANWLRYVTSEAKLTG